MTAMTEQRAALNAARRLRFEYTIAVANGILEPVDLLEMALQPSHAALRKIRLEDVFPPPDKDTPPSVRAAYVPWSTIRRRLLETLELDPRTSDRKLTVNWLHDPRAGGRRWFALHDALRPRDELPWEGFPWKPPPPG